MNFVLLAWAKENWKVLGWPVAALFCFLWLRKTDCPKVEASNTQVIQNQGVTAATKAGVAVKIVYRDRPGEPAKAIPCPEIEVVANGEENQVHWQSVSATTGAVLGPQEARKGGLVIGAGYFGQGYGLLGVEHNHFKAFGQMGKDCYGGGLTYTWMLW
jgi:hypothetical protein